MPTIDRLVPGSHEVHLHRAPSGERLWLLIDGATGWPPSIALRFALYERDHGSSARLRQLMRRLAELYDWVRHVENDDLESQAYLGEGVRLDQVTRAIRDLDVSAADGAQISIRARLRNERCWAWGTFLEFLHRPALWRTGTGVRDSHALRDELRQDLALLRDELEKCRVPLPDSKRREGLLPDELEAIESVLIPESVFCPFRTDTLQRNSAMYRYARWGGVRLGELLKAKCEDLPRSEEPGDRFVRTLQGLPQHVRVMRRPDDPDDPREREPSVKRHDREVELPEQTIESLLQYATSSAPRRKSQYLFLTDNFARPLSQSRSDKIIRQLGAAAARAYADAHGEHARHSLLKLTWHRLRHTRVLELLPVFFPDMEFDPRSEYSRHQLDSFLHYFGWAHPDSAYPYIQTLIAAAGHKKLARHYATLREHPR